MYWVAETWHLQYTLRSFLAVRSQPPVSCAQQQQCWKFLIKCTYAGICIHTHKHMWFTRKRASVHTSEHTNTQTQWQCKSASVEGGYRNLTGAILSPSAPQRHDQWGARDLAAPSWAQSVRCCAEYGLGQTAGGDGAWVDDQSPSGWDEVHQGGEWKLTRQAAGPSGQHIIVLTSCHLCKAVWDAAQTTSVCICAQVRDSLEKVRERMYGQFGGMQQSMQKLSQEIRVMNYVTLLIKLQSVKLWINLKMQCTMCVCRLPIHIGGVWSQRWGSGRQPWRALIRWTAPLYPLTSACR